MNSKLMKLRKALGVVAKTTGGIHGGGWALNLIAHKKENYMTTNYMTITGWKRVELLLQ